ncbi:hypothetical protein IEQ34_004919 [Dendrobium chrysotoxum]|uniref:Uncharacterized protein n=1 Tax=Dendrobium chrysotoxum TaxID=161865 RepID=A0AAV7H7F1_DENCH|nr:hypothetical protein IEQ34_004919 [Dendrobium chrysotoxum]
MEERDPWLAVDKLEHLIACFFISVLVAALACPSHRSFIRRQGSRRRDRPMEICRRISLRRRRQCPWHRSSCRCPRPNRQSQALRPTATQFESRSGRSVCGLDL